FSRYVYISLSLGIIVAQGGMKPQFRQKVHLVIHIEVTDHSRHRTSGMILLQPSQRVDRAPGHQLSCIIQGFGIPTEGIVARIDGDSRIPSCGIPYDTGIGKTVVITRASRVEVES